MGMRIEQYSDLQQLSRSVASVIVQKAQERVSLRHIFSLMLSGGSTPRALYSMLAEPSFRDTIAWSQVHLFWGDERCVPPDHPDSNYAMAYSTLISKIPIPEENVHRIPAEIIPSEKAAADYEKSLRDFFAAHAGSDSAGYRNSYPVFDLILLGMGADGHTASIFPGSPALTEERRWVLAVDAPPGIMPSRRITVTLPVINSAREVFFIVSGRDKKNMIDNIMNHAAQGASSFPASHVRPKEFTFFLDRTVTD